MNVDEFEKMYVEFFLKGDVLKFVRYVFWVFDLNDDGYVDFWEFIFGFSVILCGIIV